VKIVKAASLLDSLPTAQDTINALVYILRKLISRNSPENIHQFLKVGLLGTFIKLIDIENDSIKNNIIWTLINITASTSESIFTILRLGFHEKIVKTMEKTTDDILENVFFYTQELKSVFGYAGILLLKHQKLEIKL